MAPRRMLSTLVVLVASSIHALNVPLRAAAAGTAVSISPSLLRTPLCPHRTKDIHMMAAERPLAVQRLAGPSMGAGTTGDAGSSLAVQKVAGPAKPTQAPPDGFKWLAREFDELTPRQLYAVLELRQRVFVLEQKCKSCLPALNVGTVNV